MKLADKLRFVSSPVIDLISCMQVVVNYEKLGKEKIQNAKASKEIESWIVETRTNMPAEMLEELNVFFNYESFLGVTLVPYIVKEKLYEDVHAFMSGLHQMSKRELFYFFTHTGYGPEEEIADYDNPAEVIAFLEKINLPEAEKWKLSYLIFDGDRTKQRLIKLVERFYYQYYQPNEEAAQTKEEETAAFFRQMLAEGKEHYFHDIMVQYGVDWQDEEKVYIFLSNFLGPSIMFTHVKKMGVTAFVLGTNHYEASGAGRGEKETLDAVRTMTDERRFAVLQLLKKKPLYGYELAQALGVSNSTVSHHLSALVSQYFVTAIRRENKVYYEVNRDEIQKVLRHLAEILTE
ncbi:regulatory protein, arsR family [Evansella caseinilytica]|uniref:Regulatory protein, arsR family n=1 Tax=Evansella caseinilytica TaxID=1503961 RepID=A0A1H3V0J8_9BACI|nr:winged helix-turn-helix domain-containing protein [Evansella caseinilytica]SDZ68233.1 regulatory protein, arsR family [Evansella caseinilytica]